LRVVSLMSREEPQVNPKKSYASETSDTRFYVPVPICKNGKSIELHLRY